MGRINLGRVVGGDTPLGALGTRREAQSVDARGVTFKILNFSIPRRPGLLFSLTSVRPVG